jgi:8-oxo-dGTP diphosphatase
MAIGRFMAGIGALIQDPQTRRYLLLRRAAHRDFGQGDWECVTGRVDQGESFSQALHREVQEEIEARVQIDFIICTTHFYRGEPAPENELLGVLYGCTLLEPEVPAVAAGNEHSELRWLAYDEAQAFLPKGHWLGGVLERDELLRRRLPPEIIENYRRLGFEDAPG